MSDLYSYDDGKYTIINDNGHLTALRYNEPWQDVTGYKIIHSMFAETVRLAAEVSKLKEDARRYQWLTADHESQTTRSAAAAIGAAISIRGKGATDEAIDIASSDAMLIQRLVDAAQPYTAGHCSNHNQPGGCKLHNLQCGYPQCDRKQL